MKFSLSSIEEAATDHLQTSPPAELKAKAMARRPLGLDLVKYASTVASGNPPLDPAEVEL
jgi:hypothetical protein